jgi:hypothetical protein
VEKGREQNTAEQHCCSCGRLGRSLGWYLLPGRLLRDWGRARHGTARHGGRRERRWHQSQQWERPARKWLLLLPDPHSSVGPPLPSLLRLYEPTILSLEHSECIPNKFFIDTIYIYIETIVTMHNFYRIFLYSITFILSLFLANRITSCLGFCVDIRPSFYDL